MGTGLGEKQSCQTWQENNWQTLLKTNEHHFQTSEGMTCFLKRLKALISSSSSKLKYAPLSPLSFHTVWLFFVKCQKSKLPFRFFYMFQVCLPSHSCYTLLLKEMQAGNAKKIYIVFTNMKTEKTTQRHTGSFFWPIDPACGPPSLLT